MWHYKLILILILLYKHLLLNLIYSVSFPPYLYDGEKGKC